MVVGIETGWMAGKEGMVARDQSVRDSRGKTRRLFRRVLIAEWQFIVVFALYK